MDNRRIGGGDTAGNESRPPAGRGRGWCSQNKDAQQPPLRRPHSTAGSEVSGNAEQSTSGQTPISNDIVSKSKLSVDAAVFVPKGSGSQQSGRHSIQDRLLHARQEQSQSQQHYDQQRWAHQDSHPPQQYRRPHQGYEGYSQNHHANAYQNSQDYGQYNRGSGDRNQQFHKHNPNNQRGDFRNTLHELENVMYILTLKPGEFQSLVYPLLDDMAHHFDNSSQLQTIISNIIEHSINETNFRYSGARFCTCLAEYTSQTKHKDQFKEILDKLCTDKTEEQKAQWERAGEHSLEDEKKCHGLILFLAELVIQVEDSFNIDIGKLLLDLISTVLKNPGPNSAKNICQALKLAGQTLERENTGSRKEMELVMRSLTQLVTEGRVDSHISRMVNSVSELRSGNWGRGPSNTESIIPPALPLTRPLNEPVFYGPDGNVLSPEESRFLQDQADLNSLTENEPAELIELWDEEDDEDLQIAEAYEDFLKMSVNNENTPKSVGNKVRR